MISELYWRVRRMIGRGKANVQDDSQVVQLVQVQFNTADVRDSLPRLAEYGFTSSPPENFDAVVAFFGGDRSAGVVIATNHQSFRMKNLETGEVAIYDNQNQVVYLSQSGIKVQDKAGSTITMNGDGTGTGTFADGFKFVANVQIMGTLSTTGKITGGDDIQAAGNVSDQGGAKTMAGMRTAHNDHGHAALGSGSGSLPNVDM